jgi:5-methylcytosine-specific restriction protein A
MTTTYLLSWNPNKWKWRGFEAAAAKVSGGIPRRDFWTCGNTKRIRRGDRFLLIRLGSEPRGIIGGGRILSEPREVAHWDHSRKERGVAALGTDIVFDYLSVRPVVPMDELKSEYQDVWWTPQNSGMIVPVSVADEIFRLLDQYRSAPKANDDGFWQRVWAIRSMGPVSKPNGVAAPLKDSVTVERTRRNSRVAAWVQDHAGGKCELCRKTGPFVDDSGRLFLEVHHVVPLADGGPDTPSNAVALCSNCHRRAHYAKDRDRVANRLVEIVQTRKQ